MVLLVTVLLLVPLFLVLSPQTMSVRACVAALATAGPLECSLRRVHACAAASACACPPSAPCVRPSVLWVRERMRESLPPREGFHKNTAHTKNNTKKEKKSVVLRLWDSFEVFQIFQIHFAQKRKGGKRERAGEQCGHGGSAVVVVVVVVCGGGPSSAPLSLLLPSLSPVWSMPGRLCLHTGCSGGGGWRRRRACVWLLLLLPLSVVVVVVVVIVIVDAEVCASWSLSWFVVLQGGVSSSVLGARGQTLVTTEEMEGRCSAKAVAGMGAAVPASARHGA